MWFRDEVSPLVPVIVVVVSVTVVHENYSALLSP